MHKLSKKIKKWLIKANLVVLILIFAFNTSINEAKAGLDIWDTLFWMGANGQNNEKLIIGQDSLLAVGAFSVPQTITVTLTAYSSTPDQTDNTPFITASGSRARDGVIASNFLAFGTKVKVPALSGDKVFIVEDRMAKKHSDKIDIWFSERYLAKKFGVQEAEIVILE